MIGMWEKLSSIEYCAYSRALDACFPQSFSSSSLLSIPSFLIPETLRAPHFLRVLRAMFPSGENDNEDEEDDWRSMSRVNAMPARPHPERSVRHLSLRAD